MKTLILAASLALSGCATIATPQRCEVAATGLATVEQIAAVLVNNGVGSSKAALLAEIVLIGKITLAAACAAANP